MTKSFDSVRVFEQVPTPALQPFVKRFLVVEFPDLHYDNHLPDVGPVAAFTFRGGCRIGKEGAAPQAAFTGLHETLRTHEHDQGHAVLLSTFTPVGAAALLRPPLEEFAGTTVDLASILGCSDAMNQLHEQIAEAENHPRRVQLLEQFLFARLRDSSLDPLVSAAVAWLERGAGNKRIDGLVHYIGLSQSALERRFRKVVGVSPKKFASLVRLRHAIYLRSSGKDFTAFAQEAGYFDQSHFIKDFHRATGSTPEAFFRNISTE